MAAKIVAQCVHERISRVFPAAWKLTASTAILGGDSATLTAAGDLAELGPKEAAEAAEYLIGLRIFHNAEMLSFRHPVRSAGILAQLSGVGRSAARLAAAEYLYNAGAGVELVARQLIETDVVSPFQWSIDILREAARRMAMRGSLVEARRYLQRAARDSTGLEREEIEIEFCDAKVSVDLRSGIDHLVNILERSDASDRRHEILSRLGYALYLTGNHARGLRILKDISGRQSLVPGDVTTWARINLLCAEGLMNPDFELRCDAEGFWRVPSDSPPGVSAQIHGVRAFREYFTSRSSWDSVALAEKATCDSTIENAPNPLPTMAALSVLAMHGQVKKAFALAQSCLHRSCEEGKQLKSAAFEFMCGSISNILGNYLSAKRALRSAISILDDHGVWRGQPLYVQATAALLDTLVSAGELAPARNLLNDGGFAGELSSGWESMIVLLHRARLKLGVGDPQGALSDLEDCQARSATFGHVRQEIIPWRSQMVLALYQAGRHSEAAEVANEDLREARADPSPLALGRALLASGVVVGGVRGIDMHHEAVALFKECGADALLACALGELGYLLQRNQQYEEGKHALKQSLQLAKDCGATPLADLARQRSTDFNVERYRQTTAVSLLDLTAQERRVLSRALRGQSNSHIADVMCVTRRTVEMHLSSSYRKLGIRGRKDFSKIYTDADLWTILEDNSGTFR
jgi:DNA-binding CsgD family transcriptional regulator